MLTEMQVKKAKAKERDYQLADSEVRSKCRLPRSALQETCAGAASCAPSFFCPRKQVCTCFIDAMHISLGYPTGCRLRLGSWEMRIKPHDPEAPELGRAGSWEVGTRRIGVAIDDRIALTLDTFSSGSFNRVPGELQVRIWYPAATGAAGSPAHYNHVLNLPGGVRTAVSSAGFAIEHATAAPGLAFPLVVLSHGFGGWCEQFT